MPRLKASTAKLVGLLLVFICLGFVVQQLLGLDLQQIPSERWFDLSLVVLVGALLYGLVSLSLSYTWRHLLSWSDGTRAPAGLCHGIYGRSQLGKYLPGNIFSIAGRHVLGRRSGMGDRALLWAAALEILGMAFIAALLFAFGAADLGGTSQLVEVPLLAMALVVPLVLPWIMRAVLQRMPKLQPYGLPARGFGAYLRLYGTFFLYLPFFLCTAALLWWLLHEATDGQAPSFLIVLSVSAGAWLAGFVTPGASGGIGVRDALLILALKPFAGDAIVFAALAYRLLTILGDIVYFLVALAFPIEAASMTDDTRDTEPSR
ncbi:hypothetical protein [Pelagibius sp.]|uniref:hypothetical protein n=1 Tax=Pelagibius sp. TaxID=1931238 RepID=UPI002626FE5D|nr:hypothetical protein [Pelagibius sp.]